jgi:hypothetical protein
LNMELTVHGLVIIYNKQITFQDIILIKIIIKDQISPNK